MDGGLDSVEKAVPFMPAERVNPSHRSEREKERKFAQTLEEEFEEEQKKDRKAHDKDTVTLSDDADKKLSQDHQSDHESTQDEPDVEENEKESTASPEEGHIDLKA